MALPTRRAPSFLEPNRAVGGGSSRTSLAYRHRASLNDPEASLPPTVLDRVPPGHFDRILPFVERDLVVQGGLQIHTKRVCETKHVDQNVRKFFADALHVRVAVGDLTRLFLRQPLEEFQQL